MTDKPETPMTESEFRAQVEALSEFAQATQKMLVGLMEDINALPVPKKMFVLSVLGPHFTPYMKQLEFIEQFYHLEEEVENDD